MAQKKTNYNKEILFALHRPRTKTGFPLYTKVAGYNGSSDAIGTQAETDEIYRRESPNKFNSPTNIRRVFICSKYVEVERYVTSKGDGANKAVIERVDVRSYNNSIREVIRNMATNNQRMAEYREEKVINKGIKEPDIYSLCGDVIGVISNPYTCNNIEEVYIDWTALLCNEVKPYFKELASDAALNAFMAGNYNPKEIKNNIMLDYFTAFNSGGAKDIRTRFPRLRVIGLISNLEEVLDAALHSSVSSSDMGISLAFSIEKSCIQSQIKYKFPTWYEVVKQMGCLDKSLCVISTINTKLPNTNFVIKDNQYKFDRDILKGYVDRYCTLVKDSLREIQYSKSSDNIQKKEDKVEVAGEIETEVLRLVQQRGMGFAQIALTVATTGMTKTQLEEMFKSFTDENRNNMAKLIGLNIE